VTGHLGAETVIPLTFLLLLLVSRLEHRLSKALGCFFNAQNAGVASIELLPAAFHVGRLNQRFGNEQLTYRQALAVSGVDKGLGSPGRVM
jgi:hypothetical protein